MQENRQPQKRILTIGAGQLGLMLSKAAKKLGIEFEYRSIPDTWNFIDALNDKGPFLVTFEQEYIDELLLREIDQRSIECFPSLKSFELLRNKYKQKLFLKDIGIPTADFASADQVNDFLKSHGGTGILKAGRGGYDGQGVWVLDKDGNAQGQTGKVSTKELIGKIESPYIEEKVNFDFEIASVVCRSKSGNIVSYPTVKTIQKNGVCTEVEFSCEFADTPIAKRAEAIGQTIAKKLDYVGVLAIELFVKGDLLFVNEIAPRVHNSGHFTIDVCEGSQFENHLRAGLDWPLASTIPIHASALMVNLLWPKDHNDFAQLYTRLTCGSPWPNNIKLHWYGKSEIRPLRKMGHFTVYGNDIGECRKEAQQILAQRWA